jgi:hypothetical protein
MVSLKPRTKGLFLQVHFQEHVVPKVVPCTFSAPRLWLPKNLKIRALFGFIWCPEGDLNPHDRLRSADFKSAVSADFTIRAFALQPTHLFHANAFPVNIFH